MSTFFYLFWAFFKGPYPYASVGASMELEGWDEINIQDEIHTGRKESIMRRMFFLMKAPDTVLPEAFKERIRQCDKIPKADQILALSVDLPGSGMSRWIMRKLFNDLHSDCEANELSLR